MQDTSVTFLLDKSGSMGSIKQPTIDGFNAYLKGLQEGEAAEATKFTFIQFDSYSVDKIHVGVTVKNVPELDDKTYRPDGGTPLIDAAVKTIKAVDAANKDCKIVVCIQTDGHENASTENTWHDLNTLIKDKKALGWEFIFLGVGIDAYDQAGKMGIGVANTISSTLDANQMKSAYRSLGANTAMYASGHATSTSFSLHQKSAAGDYTASGGKWSTVGSHTVGSHTVGSHTAGGPASQPYSMPDAKKPKKPKVVDDIDLTK